LIYPLPKKLILTAKEKVLHFEFILKIKSSIFTLHIAKNKE